jgi:hypothetical protein
MEPTLIFGAIGAVMSVGGVGVWAVRTEGKITTLKALVDERDEKLDKRLERMEDKIDKVLLSAQKS